MTTDQLQRMIETALPGARATVTDMTGTGNHFDAVIVSPTFAGRSAVQRHQAVYALFREELADERIHALKLSTLTPEEV